MINRFEKEFIIHNQNNGNLARLGDRATMVSYKIGNGDGYMMLEDFAKWDKKKWRKFNKDFIKDKEVRDLKIFLVTCDDIHFICGWREMDLNTFKEIMYQNLYERA